MRRVLTCAATAVAVAPLALGLVVAGGFFLIDAGRAFRRPYARPAWL